MSEIHLLSFKKSSLYPFSNRHNVPTSMRLIPFISILAFLFCFDRSFSRQQDEFASVDAYALSIPRSEATTIEHLAAILTRNATGDREKARALYRWITKNVSYDTHAFFSGDLGDMSANNVLKTLKGVCDGYAQLFAALATSAGLNATRIGGNSKGYGYVVGSKIESSENHAWNAVKIDGVWKLVDCTWGAGYIDERKRFVERFNDYYFLTPPEQFIYDHFPENPDQQFLNPPVSNETYESFVDVRPVFFTYGLTLKSHRQGVVRAAGRVDIVIGTPSKIQLLVQLLRDGKALDPTFTHVYRRGDESTLSAVFPEAGTYVARLFVRPRSDAGRPMEKALDYQIDVSAPMPKPVSFPVVYEAFEGYSLELRSAAEHETRVDRLVTVNLQSPPGIQIIASLERNGSRLPDGFTFVQSEGGSHTVQAVFPQPGPYTLTIFAKRATESGNFNAVLSSTFESMVMPDAHAGFPTVYQQYRDRNAWLFFPMEGTIRANTPQQFKIRVPGAEAVSVMANGKWFPLGKDGDVFQGSVTLGKGKVEVFANFANSRQYIGLLAYEAID